MKGPDGCPNGHSGGVFCCVDNVNRVMEEFQSRYPRPEQHYLMPVTLDEWNAYQELLKAQEDD